MRDRENLRSHSVDFWQKLAEVVDGAEEVWLE
jgi:hypothetical protein